MSQYRRILVCGSRTWQDRKFLYKFLNRIVAQVEVIIEGEAPGADTMAREWAHLHEIKVHPYPADWEKYGKAAGPIRNRQMIKEGKPDLVIAFHPDILFSKGTKNMVTQAGEWGIEVWDAVKMVENPSKGE